MATSVLSLACVQLNMHNASLAAVQLSQRLGEDHALAFISEPYTAFGKIVTLPLGYTIFPQVPMDPAPRAGLVIPNHLPAVFLPQFSNRDSAAALITIGLHKYLVLSGYCDITMDPIQSWLVDATRYVEAHGYKMVVGLDTNAHSGLFGPQDNN